MLEPLDRVLGGGVVVGSVILIAGDPGAGKSSLTAAALRGLVNDRPVLYATGEESIAQAAMRARRLNATHDRILIVSESNVDAIIAHARAIRPSTIVVDSISCLTTDDLGSAAGSVQQVRECASRLAAFAKATDTAMILIGHVTRGAAHARSPGRRRAPALPERRLSEPALPTRAQKPLW
jgi:DNA repair protein RadA/Sms